MLKISLYLILMLATASLSQGASQGGRFGERPWGDFPSISRAEVESLLNPDVDYYEVLGFQSGSSPGPDEIRERVRELRRRFHEDLARGRATEADEHRIDATREEAVQLMGKILTAAEVLANPVNKSEYDRQRNQAFEESMRRVVETDTNANMGDDLAGDLDGDLLPEDDIAEPSVATPQQPPPRWRYQPGAAGTNERVVNRYVRQFKRAFSLKKWWLRALKEHHPMISDPNFAVAVQRFLYEVTESKFRPNVMSRPLWRAMMPEEWKWSNYLHSFDTFPFDLLHDFMRALTSDRQVNLAMHLLVLDRIDPMDDAQRYYQAIGLTFGWFGDIIPEVPVFKLYDHHMTAQNMLELFNDQTGALALRKTRKREPVQRIVHRAAIARYISIDPSHNRIISELRIRSVAASSEIWSNELFRGQDRANMAVLQRLVARYPLEWTVFREELFKMGQERSRTSYAKSKLNRIYKYLEAIDRAAQKRLRDQQRQREFQEKVQRVRARATTWWDQVKQACYNIFWAD